MAGNGRKRVAILTRQLLFDLDQFGPCIVFWLLHLPRCAPTSWLPDRPRGQFVLGEHWQLSGWWSGPESLPRYLELPVGGWYWAWTAWMGPWGMGRYVNSVVLSRSRAADPRGPNPPAHPTCCKVLQWFPHGAPLFSRSRMDHLTPGKTKWISPDRAPRSWENSNVLRGHPLGRALTRQNPRPDDTWLWW